MQTISYARHRFPPEIIQHASVRAFTGRRLLSTLHTFRGDVAGVASAFSNLGMSPDMVNQFVPVILEYAQSAGSEQAMQLLQGAFTAL